MKKLTDIDLTGATQSFGLANTPFFLLRKLKGDPAVTEIGTGFSEDEILKALRTALDGDPTEPSNAVRPYAYLVALWQKPRPDSLRTAVTLRADKWGWYRQIALALLETYSPISTQILSPARVNVPSAMPTSGVPANKIIFEP